MKSIASRRYLYGLRGNSSHRRSASAGGTFTSAVTILTWYSIAVAAFHRSKYRYAAARLSARRDRSSWATAPQNAANAIPAVAIWAQFGSLTPLNWSRGPTGHHLVSAPGSR